MRKTAKWLAPWLALAGCIASPPTMMAREIPDANALTVYYNYQTGLCDLRVVSFDMAKPGSLNTLYTLPNDDGLSIGAGCRVRNTYYYFQATNSPYGFYSDGLFALDVNDGSTRKVGDYGHRMEGTVYASMTYDYSSETMFALGGFGQGDNIVSVDLENGNVKKLSNIKINEVSGYDGVLACIGVNYDGEMYGISFPGILYRINPWTGEVRRIGALDYNPDGFFNYQHSYLVFDNETNDCYWSFYTWTNKYEIRKVNLSDATTEPVGNVETQIDGLYIPFIIAGASAPGKATDFNITPAQKGELKAVLEWKNPSKTFGRGGELQSMTKLELYRDGELLNTWDNPIPGAVMTYTDIPAKSDYYTYKIIGYNESGAGDRCSNSAFIGSGIPSEVEHLTLVADGNNAVLSWSQPENGKFGAWLDKTSLVYEITRQPDGVVLTSDCKSNTFTDTSITTLGKYYYDVKGINSGGIGDDVSSNKEICGPPLEVPSSFQFYNEEDTDIWTVIDGNGNYYTWTWADGYYGSIRGWTSSYNTFDGMAAHEYLISPKMRLEQGKRYKLTFDATPGDKNIPEIIAVSLGKAPTAAAQDSITQFTIRNKGKLSIRADIPPVAETGDYHFGFVHRSTMPGYKLSIGNISIDEDHSGRSMIFITDESGNPVENAAVTVGGKITAVSKGEGMYEFPYLDPATYTAIVTAIGYEDATLEFEVIEGATTETSLRLSSLPRNTLSGKVIDSLGDPVPDAKVTLTGYAPFETYTDREGAFSIAGIYAKEAYALTVSRNNYLSYSSMIDMDTDKILETIILADNPKAPREASATEDGVCAHVEWAVPLGDAITLRFDDGSRGNALGMDDGTVKTLFGNVFRTPSVVKSVQFMLASLPGVSHYGVSLYIMDLDEQGNPTDKVLFSTSYAACKDDEWSVYRLPKPVDAPRGFMAAVACEGFIGLCTDSGEDQNYPFKEQVSAYTTDFSSGRYAYVESQNFRANFMLRAEVEPYGPISTKAPATFAFRTEAHNTSADMPCFVSKAVSKLPQRVVEDRLSYDVYRFVESAKEDDSQWIKVASNLKDRFFDDTGWKDLPKGVYQYAVKTLYAANEASEPTITNAVGRDMHSDINIYVCTDTETNESTAAIVTFANKEGRGIYTTGLDSDCKARIEYMWKGDYTATVVLDGFETVEIPISIGDDNEYDFTFNLREIKQIPAGLRIVEEGNAGERLFVWDFPDIIADSFEDHEPFTVNSPGSIGWGYYDGDGEETGAFSNYVWPNQWVPMAWIVFDPDKTEPSILRDNLMPQAQDGNQYIVSMGSKRNDDWIISPRLFFEEDFLLSFYACGWSPYGAPEHMQVGWSMTTSDPDQFEWQEEILLPGQQWENYVYEIPADASYVAIRYTSAGQYMGMIDNIRIGLPDAMSSSASRPSRAPSKNGMYEVFLNGNKVGQTSLRQFIFQELAPGKYTAGVRRAYTSGYSGMANIDFTMDDSGVKFIDDAESNISMSYRDRILTIEGDFDVCHVVDTAGKIVALTEDTVTNLDWLTPGIYIARATGQKDVAILRFIVK